MNPCEQAGHDVRTLAVRIPVHPNAPIQVERACFTYGCRREDVGPFIEEPNDPERELILVFGGRGQLGPGSIKAYESIKRGDPWLSRSALKGLVDAEQAHKQETRARLEADPDDKGPPDA